nr:unnamed protein product [Haemonchus contortus]
MLQRFRYPHELSRLVAEVEKLQDFEECGERDVRLLRRVKLVLPKDEAEFIKSAEVLQEESHYRFCLAKVHLRKASRQDDSVAFFVKSDLEIRGENKYCGKEGADDE